MRFFLGLAMPLPIKEIEIEFLTAYRDESRVILEAPTGSGKSTQIPQMLLKAGFLNDGELIVLQPRRIAARMLARRVAFELGERMGERVGYQIRNESCVSKETRVRFVTEGILLRRFINDPELRGVSGIVFDEFHERSLHGDLTLARALMTQASVRPDLKIVAMSATLDAASLENYLNPCAIVRSEGRTFPVAIEHREDRGSNRGATIWDAAAQAVSQAAKEEPDGHILVFMPGAYEIGRTIRALGQRLSSSDFKLLPLHSELSSRDQDEAMDPSARRKVIVSTNVAETSLTIEDVRVVVDSGQARIARYDPMRGINTLWIEKISHASAKQRAGRAGRTGPGKCIRLWSERDHAQRLEFDEPEALRMDLSEVILTLMASGVEDLESFPWFERPSAERMQEAYGLLRMLGAVDNAGKLTRDGRRMSEFPLHPRYGAMMLAADRFGCVQEMSLAAAVAQTRGILIRKVDKAIEKRRESLLGECGNSDLIAQMRAWSAASANRFEIGFCKELGIHAQSARQASSFSKQIFGYAKYADLNLIQEAPATEEAIVQCLLVGFPDRVCRRLDRGTLRCEMVGGLRASLARESLARDATLLVSCEISEIGKQGGDVSTVLSLCSEIDRAWLEQLFPKDFQSGVETVYDERQKRVVERTFVRYRDLAVESKENLDVDLDAAATALAALIGEGKAKLDKWDKSADGFIDRVKFVSHHFPEYEIESFGEDSRALLIEQCCHGARSLRDLKRQEVLPQLKEWFGVEVAKLVESEAPDRIRLANGRPARVRYEANGKAILSAKIQDLYDLKEPLSLCQGRCRPTIELLAPNMRPIQLTDDLSAFWTNSYPGIKKELKGRYPKHEWR